MRASIATIPQLSLQGDSPYHYAVLTVLDSTFAAFVVAPAVIAYWRSTWELMGIYVYPNDPMMSATVSIIVGFVGHAIFTIGQRVFEKLFHPDKHRILFYVGSRVYTSIFALVCVNGWRGPWQLLDQYTEMELTTVIVTTTVGVVALAVMRTLRNILAAPFAVVPDNSEGFFEIVSMFRVPMQKTSLYLLDCIFSVYIVGTLVVFVWRGVWMLLDMYLYPLDEVLSAWASLILGYSGAIFAYAMQPVMRWICDRLVGAPRLLAADIFLLICFFFTVNTWRGIWNLLNIYFLPDNKELSCWITHWICLILLILLKCSNSLLVRGVYIDAEEPGGKCVVFPVYYLRLIFQHEKTKKIKKIQLDIINKQYNNENDVSKRPACAVISNHVAVNINSKDLKHNSESNTK